MERGVALVKKCITGFFMAWGMFLAVPCPYKRWDEAARGQMLCALPFIGAVVGGFWVLCAWLSGFLPAALGAVLCAAAPWLVTGFFHLDGYMDVCDAVLSRRDLETRQRILKDSRCGAFAVIGMVLLALCQWSAFLGAWVPWGALLFIPVASRGAAALAVQTLRPMGTSQYAALAHKPAPVVWSALLLALAAVLPLFLWHSFAALAAAAVYWLCVLWAGRQLGGMSGDVSGFALTLGELAGALVAVCVR